MHTHTHTQTHRHTHTDTHRHTHTHTHTHTQTHTYTHTNSTYCSNLVIGEHQQGLKTGRKVKLLFLNPNSLATFVRQTYQSP